jgi:hypothetical protein
MKFHDILRETQISVRHVMTEVESRVPGEDELLAWFQLEKDLLVVMTKLLELDAQQGGALADAPAGPNDSAQETA